MVFTMMILFFIKTMTEDADINIEHNYEDAYVTFQSMSDALKL